MRVYLVGYMGSGKSTFGKKLANKLGCDLIDLDTMIESNEGSRISEIFTRKGEEEFRRIEAESLRAIDIENAVIATGGGCPCHFSNIDFMNGNGTTVYLEMSTSAAVSRLKQGRKSRPLLAPISEEELPVFIENHLASRQYFYEKAQIKTAAIDVDLEEVVRQIQAR